MGQQWDSSSESPTWACGMVHRHSWGGRGERLCSWRCQCQQAGSLRSASCTSSRTLGVTLLHKRVENSLSQQGCHSEMTARPAAVLPHKNHAHSLHSVGIFGIPSEVVAPGNVSESQGSYQSRQPKVQSPPWDLGRCHRLGWHCHSAAPGSGPATEPRRFSPITATS